MMAEWISVTIVSIVPPDTLRRELEGSFSKTIPVYFVNLSFRSMYLEIHSSSSCHLESSYYLFSLDILTVVFLPLFPAYTYSMRHIHPHRFVRYVFIFFCRAYLFGKTIPWELLHIHR